MPLTLLQYEVTPKQSYRRQLDSIVHLLVQLANLSKELCVQIAFALLLRHPTMLLRFPLYAFEWLGFTSAMLPNAREAHKSK